MDLPSSEDLEEAKAVLRRNGVDPDNLSRGQLYTFASSHRTAQAESLEAYLASLRIDGEEDEEESVVNGSNTSPQDDDGTETLAAAQDLLRRCHELMAELQNFNDFLRDANDTRTNVEYKNFRDALKAEFKYLTKLTSSSHSTGERIQHNIKSSNLPYYEAVWGAAKRSSEIVNLRKWYYRERPQNKERPANDQGIRQHSRNPEKARAMVDVVAESGDLWIKVSTVTNQRVLFDLAKLGWQNDALDSDEDMEDFSKPRADESDSDDEDEIPLVQTAKELVRTAKANLIRGHPPRIAFVVPRIFPGHPKDSGAIDFAVNKIRAAGVTVITAPDLSPTPSLQSVLTRLQVDQFKGITSTLNIDCTVLLALVSDISHQEVPQQPWFPNAVNQQIIVERKQKLLPTVLYPVLSGRSLVCTQEAAIRMQEIVETIGTASEITRTNILLAPAGTPYASISSQELLFEMQKTSNHTVPPSWILPIKIVDKESMGLFESLPRLARFVSPHLSEINRSVFMYGWISGYTTISSNATVAHQIEKTIEEKREAGDEGVVGPMVWLCAESRSLVAKKGRGDFGKATVKKVIR